MRELHTLRLVRPCRARGTQRRDELRAVRARGRLALAPPANNASPWSSFGNGATNCTPCAGKISLISVSTISTFPAATVSTDSSTLLAITIFGFISAAIPSLSSACSI